MQERGKKDKRIRKTSEDQEQRFDIRHFNTILSHLVSS